MAFLTNRERTYFSLVDANKALKYFGRNAVDLAKLYLFMEEQKRKRDGLIKRAKDPKSNKAALKQLWEIYDNRYSEAQEKMRDLACEIIQAGAKIDDLSLGLISFPSDIVEPDLTRRLFTWMQEDGNRIKLWRREGSYVEDRTEIPDWVR